MEYTNRIIYSCIIDLYFGGYLPPQTVGKLRFVGEWTSAIRVEQFKQGEKEISITNPHSSCNY
jgi:hypothetical protein